MVKSLFFIVIFIVLVGCAGQPVDTALPPDWSTSGKLSVRNAQQAQSARFRWQEWRSGSQTQYRVEVWGPLGQGRTVFAGSADELKVTRGERLIESGPALDIMLRHLGFQLPLAVLGGWLDGDPGPSAVVQTLDASGRVAQFDYANWQVGFSRYSAEIDGKPRRIRAEQGEYSVTVALAREIAQD